MKHPQNTLGASEVRTMEIQSVTQNKKYQSKSAMIKDLFFVKKMKVGEISSKEGILYQHVRNVVKTEEDRRLIEKIKKDKEKEAKKAEQSTPKTPAKERTQTKATKSATAPIN